MADANTLGRAALTIGGAVLFGPWGALAGGLLSSFLFPVEAPQGPRLNELNVQHSTVGAPIQLRYGTCKGAGNVIWSGGLREIEGDSGGKGTPSAPTPSHFIVSAAIGICDGEDGSPAQPAGIRRIWGDADLLYDSSDDATLGERLQLGGVAPADIAAFIAQVRAMSAQLDFVFYNGAEDQLPDPTIEAHEGVGNVPAFRGLAYVVFTDFNCANFGNRLPNFTIETYSGTPTECGIYSPGTLYPWIEGGLDPRNPLNSHVYRVGVVNYTSFDDAAAALEAGVGKTLFTDDAYLHAWNLEPGGHTTSPCDGITSGDQVNLYLQYNVVATSTRVCILPPGSGNPCDNGFAEYGVGVPFWRPGSQHGLYVIVDTGEEEEQYFNGYTGSGSVTCTDGLHYITDISDEHLHVKRSLLPPSPCAYGTPLAGAPGYCVVNGQVTQGITWTEVSGTFHVLQKYADNAVVVSAYPVGPALRSDDPDYNNQAYWEAAYAQALADGEPIAGGLTYGVDYPETQSGAYFSECATVDTACVPMATIVSDICRRAGLRTDTATQIDVSGLTTCVTGYTIGRQMSGREALQPLRMFGLWDAVEGELLRFVERAGAIVATLTEDDLGAHENGDEAPPAVTVSRLQEKELPRRVRLHFANFDKDHEASEQSASRITTEAVNELDVELPISMTPDTAAQLADIMLYAEWVGRNTYTFALDNDWLHLEPTDCIEIPVEGETQRVRILAVNYKIGGILEVEAQRDDDGSYTSVAVGNPGTPSGGVPGSSGNGPICPSAVVLLDIPRLREQDTDAGYYAAIYGLCPDFWSCAELYRSSDGGTTFQRVGRTDLETTVGEIITITGPATDPTLPGESPAYDTTTSITVELFEGTLASITDAQIAAGQNLAAVGVDGRWVLIQFKTATLDTGDQWTLTDLIWGLNDTQHLLYTTVAGDSFVLLSDTGLLRISESADAIGVEKQFKILSCGESIDAVTEFDFTTWGLSYQRLCPSSVISATLTTPPSGAVDGDAYLLPNDTSLTDEWADHGGEIATWSDETESWVFCTPVPGTIIRIGADSSSDPGDDSVISDGDGTYHPPPWTPAIPPLAAIDTSTDLDTSYFVVHTGSGYRKALGSEIGGGGVTNVSTTDRVLGRDTAGAGPVEELTLSQVLDFIGSAAQGDILYRGASTWARLGAGSSGQFLKTLGAAANPIWSNVSGTGDVGVLDLEHRYDWYNDCESGLGWTSAVSSGGTISTPTPTYKHHGVFQLATGTTISASVFYGYGLAPTSVQQMMVLHATDEFVMDFLFMVSDAQTGTHQYETYMGALDNIGAGSDGVTFGNKWSGSADVWFIRGAVNGVITTSNGSSGPTPGTWHHGRMVCTTALITLYIDGASVATLNTGIPTAGFRPMMGIAKLAGSGVDRQLHVDFVHFYQDWDSDRY